MQDNPRREELVFLAEIYEQGQRYEDLVDTMKQILALPGGDQLTTEEWNLLSVGFKCVIGSKRCSWRVLTSIRQKDTLNNTSESKLRVLDSYIDRVAAEGLAVCREIIAIVNDVLLPTCQDPLKRATMTKTMSDFYRYLSELLPDGPEKVEAKETCLNLLNVATCMPPTHPITLGMALSRATWLYEMENDPATAIEIARNAFDAAIAELDTISEDVSHELRGNVNILGLQGQYPHHAAAPR
jgi:14-3-3 protein epsilon